jgi:hypothetical protein
VGHFEETGLVDGAASAPYDASCLGPGTSPQGPWHQRVGPGTRDATAPASAPAPARRPRHHPLYPIASTTPSHKRALASSASVAVSTASSHRPSSAPHRSATMAIAIGVCSSPSTSMCRAR